MNDKLYAKTNIVNLLIWGLWWPSIVWMSVLFGRVWCMVCPLELIANGTERFARRLGIKQLVLGMWLQSGTLIVGIYALIQLLVSGINLHRVPAYTSVFLWGLLSTAALAGFFFKDRAFCRGFCPIGLLLGTYGRGSMLAVRAGSDQVCGTCTGKDCIKACNRTRLDGRSCPSLLNPPKLNSSRDCLVCGQCIKSCKPDNMQLVLRRPFHPADTREPLASWPTTIFVMLVSGFVTYELCTEWNVAKSVLLWIPASLSSYFGFSSAMGWIKGIWIICIYPTILWFVLGVISVFTRRSISLTHSWRLLALPLVVIVSAGHMAKGLAKFTSWIGFLPYALKDPSGIETVSEITSKTISQPGPILSLPSVSVAGIVLIVAGLCFSIREARLANPETYHRHLVPNYIVASLFLFIITGWGLLQ
uniref:4Fe-4S binding protein n=1 Tax=Candidatus Loosdrechtia sp. TaxID=3101272 RepID=UPI00403B04E4